MKQLLVLSLIAFFSFQLTAGMEESIGGEEEYGDMNRDLNEDEYGESDNLNGELESDIDFRNGPKKSSEDYPSDLSSLGYGLNNFGEFSHNEYPLFEKVGYNNHYYEKPYCEKYHYSGCKHNYKRITLVHWKSDNYLMQNYKFPIEDGFSSRCYDDETYKISKGGFGSVDPESSCELQQNYEHIGTKWKGETIVLRYKLPLDFKPYKDLKIHVATNSNSTVKMFFNGELLGQKTSNECPKKGDGNFEFTVDDKFISKCGQDVIVVRGENPNLPRFLDIKVTGKHHYNNHGHHHHHHHGS